MAAVGHFDWQTSVTAGNTISLPADAAPAAILLWCTSVDSAVDAVQAGDIRSCIGIGTGSATRYAFSTFSEDGVTTTDTGRGNRSDAILAILDDANGDDGRLDISAFVSTPGSEEVTLIIDQQLAIADVRVHYVIWNTLEAPDASVGTGTIPTSTGTQTVTGVGHEPGLLFLLTNDRPLDNQVNGASFSIGATDGVNQWVVAGRDRNNQGTTDSSTYMREDECLAVVTGTVERRAGILVSDPFQSDGFKLDWLETTGAPSSIFAYLSLGGGQYQVGSFSSSTSTGAITSEQTGFGFQPSGSFFGSHCENESASDVSDAHMIASLGAADGTNQGAQGMASEDAVGTSRTAVAVEFDSVYARLQESADTLDGTISLTRFVSDGMTLNQDLADDTVALVGYAAWASIFAKADAGPQASGELAAKVDRIAKASASPASSAALSSSVDLGAAAAGSPGAVATLKATVDRFARMSGAPASSAVLTPTLELFAKASASPATSAAVATSLDLFVKLAASPAASAEFRPIALGELFARASASPQASASVQASVELGAAAAGTPQASGVLRSSVDRPSAASASPRASATLRPIVDRLGRGAAAPQASGALRPTIDRLSATEALPSASATLVPAVDHAAKLAALPSVSATMRATVTGLQAYIRTYEVTADIEYLVAATADIEHTAVATADIEVDREEEAGDA